VGVKRGGATRTNARTEYVKSDRKARERKGGGGQKLALRMVYGGGEKIKGGEIQAPNEKTWKEPAV